MCVGPLGEGVYFYFDGVGPQEEGLCCSPHVKSLE